MAQTFEHIWTRKPMIVSLSVKVIICFCLSWKNWLHSGLLKNLEQNKLLLNLENFTSHCLKNPEIWLVLLIGPLLIRTYCVYMAMYLSKGYSRVLLQNLNQSAFLSFFFFFYSLKYYHCVCKKFYKILQLLVQNFTKFYNC